MLSLSGSFVTPSRSPLFDFFSMTGIIPGLLWIQPENLRGENEASRAPWELKSVAVLFCCL
jgi:hypothetical protein